MSMSPPVPPLPSVRSAHAATSQAVAKRGLRRLPWWTWTLILLLVGGCFSALVLGGIVVGRFLGEGWDVFEEDARMALQRNPTIQTHIGTIEDMHLNLTATGNAVHPEDFVFDLEGNRGAGRVHARFETTEDGGERIDEGELRMEDGTKWPLVADPEG